MKRIGNIFSKICELDNLRLADQRARKGKLYQKGVIEHDQNREGNLLHLRDILLNKTYTTSSYTIFTIFDPKEREIYRLPYYPDRIVHHAIMNVIGPIFVSVFTADTYSCIKGRGIHKAMRAMKKALKDKVNTVYCLKFDIRKFYPSINIEILKKLLRRKFKDPDLLWLLDDIIDSVKDSGGGVPIGNYLSQYLANFYLAYFDHWIKENLHVKYYFRYADDIVILSSDKQYLHQLLEKIKQYLSDLQLMVKPNHRIFPTWMGIDFLGYVFRQDYIKVRKGIKKNFARMLKYTPNKKSISSYLGWTSHADCRNLEKSLLNDHSK